MAKVSQLFIRMLLKREAMFEYGVAYSLGVICNQYGFDAIPIDSEHIRVSKKDCDTTYYFVKQHPTWCWLLESEEFVLLQCR